jgi:hypothetical protein
LTRSKSLGSASICRYRTSSRFRNSSTAHGHRSSFSSRSCSLADSYPRKAVSAAAYTTCEAVNGRRPQSAR